jgi:hypothetical protein
MLDSSDYTLVPESAWNTLFEWYGNCSRAGRLANGTV